MNEVLQIIHNRRSVRAYSDQPLSENEKGTILAAAMRAPTAGNMMLYTIIEVEDQKLKDRLAETCDHQPFIAKAPFVLLFLADYQRWFDLYQASGVEEKCKELGKTYRTPQEGDLMLACCDALIAAQTAVLAAEALGINSCYIGDILENYEIHRELFSLPRYVLPITMLCFGYPAVPPDPAKRVKRFSKEYIVHKNSYRQFSPAELEEMVAPFASQTATYPAGAMNFGQHNFFRKFTADFSIEMNRSVRAMIDTWTASEKDNGDQ